MHIMPNAKSVYLSIFTLVIACGLTSAAWGSGPYWHVGGARLEVGKKQIKLQVKDPAVLKFPTLNVEIECKNSISEGATIEGNGTNQGQDKGRVTYTRCTFLKPAKEECTVAQPITTNPLKSYLATAETQTRIVDVFEPTEGLTFVILKFSKGCGAALEGERGINGSIAAELIPSEKELQEGLAVFPTTAISVVKHEGVEKKLKLECIGTVVTFNTTYGARLSDGTPFGVFEL